MHGMQCILYKILLYMNILRTRVLASVVVSAWYGTVHPVAASVRPVLAMSFCLLTKKGAFCFCFPTFCL